MEVFVIIQSEDESQTRKVIGVCSSIDECNRFIDEYFVKYKVLEFRDIRDSGIEFEKTIEVDFGSLGVENCHVTVMSFFINEL